MRHWIGSSGFGRRVTATVAIALAAAIFACPATAVTPTSTAVQPDAHPVNAGAPDPSLYRPHGGDSPAVAAIRAQLMHLADVEEAAGQQYNRALDIEQQTARQLVVARQQDVAATVAAEAATQQLRQMLSQEYRTYAPFASISPLFTAKDQGSLADKLQTLSQLSVSKTVVVDQATAAQSAAAAATARVATLQATAAAAVIVARKARDAAAKAVSDGEALLATTEAAELAAALRAAATGPIAGGSGTPSDAAVQLRAQALATGAAQPKDFLHVTTAVAVIAVATRALLRQAAGLGSAPRGGNGATFRVAGDTPTDETAVMGPAPALGGTGQYSTKVPGSASARSLTVFADDPAPAEPSAGADPGPVAPALKPDGVTVHPSLPPLGPGRHLRAEIAVDTALSEIGSPYVWAASGPSTFDCSGLTQWAWGAAGVSLAHFAGTQLTQGVRLAVDELLPGDLIMFGADLHHVGMYLGAGYMVDAPHTGTYVRIEKVASFGDFVAAVRP